MQALESSESSSEVETLQAIHTLQVRLNDLRHSTTPKNTQPKTQDNVITKAPSKYSLGVNMYDSSPDEPMKIQITHGVRPIVEQETKYEPAMSQDTFGYLGDVEDGTKENLTLDTIDNVSEKNDEQTTESGNIFIKKEIPQNLKVAHKGFSKQQLLSEVRKQKQQHRRQIR